MRIMDVKQKVSEGKMERNAEVARRVKALRGTQTQAEFASQLGVTQPMISSWEAGRDEPTVENLLAFAELAGYPDCFWFWERAGLNKQRLLSAAERIRKEQIKDIASPAIKDQIVLVPCVRKTPQGLDMTGEHVPMPAVKVPNPASTYCFLFSGAAARRTELAPIVDTTNADTEHFTEFLGSLILAEFSSADGYFSSLDLGLQIGGLFREEGHEVEEGLEHFAYFVPLQGPPRGAIAVGRGVEQMIGGTIPVDVRNPRNPEKLIRFWRGFTILGRVLAL